MNGFLIKVIGSELLINVVVINFKLLSWNTSDDKSFIDLTVNDWNFMIKWAIRHGV